MDFISCLCNSVFTYRSVSIRPSRWPIEKKTNALEKRRFKYCSVASIIILKKALQIRIWTSHLSGWCTPSVVLCMCSANWARFVYVVLLFFTIHALRLCTKLLITRLLTKNVVLMPVTKEIVLSSEFQIYCLNVRAIRIIYLFHSRECMDTLHKIANFLAI